MVVELVWVTSMGTTTLTFEPGVKSVRIRDEENTTKLQKYMTEDEMIAITATIKILVLYSD